MTQCNAQIMLLCLASALSTMKHKMVSDFATGKCFSIHTSPPSFFHNSSQYQKEKTLLSTFKSNIRYIVFFYVISFCRDMYDVFGTQGTTLPHQMPEGKNAFIRHKLWWKQRSVDQMSFGFHSHTAPVLTTIYYRSTWENRQKW